MAAEDNELAAEPGHFHFCVSSILFGFYLGMHLSSFAASLESLIVLLLRIVPGGFYLKSGRIITGGCWNLNEIETE